MRRALRPLLLILAMAGLPACRAGEDDGVRVVVIGDPAAPFDAGPRLSPAAQLVRAATSEGLVAFDDEGHVVPALADRWIVGDDGLSYIFRLRDGAFAGNTAPAAQARTALQQAIAALRGTALGLDLEGIEEVRAMAGRVIEIRLSRPEPDLLLLLAQPELGLRKGRAASPMTLRRVGNLALLTPLPPEKRGQPAIENWNELARPVRLAAGPATTALRDFAAGKVEYVLGGGFADLPRIGRLALGRSRPRFDPVTGLFGLQVTATQGLLADPLAREAVARAIDRDALGQALGIPGWSATTRIVPPGTEGDSGQVDERWQGQPMAARQADAARIIAARVTSLRNGPARLRLALPQGPGADALFARLHTDLAQIGITLERTGEAAPAELRLIDLVARRARASWFLAQLSCATRRGACSDLADNAAARARATSDPRAAADAWAQAEATLTQANVYIPLGVPIRWSLVASDNAGFALNRWAIHPLFQLATRGN